MIKAETDLQRQARLLRQAIISTVPCPQCKAGAGEACRMPTRKATLPHQARRSAPADAGVYRP